MSFYPLVIHIFLIFSNLLFYFSYKTTSKTAVIRTILITMEIEFTALASPKSLFISAVKAGAAEAMGLKGRIARACRYSRGSGMKK